jgi:hypothetical protein
LEFEQKPQIYSQDYRHFDVLIWQVPSWASAVFALTIASAATILANGRSIVSAISLTAQSVAASFLLTMSLVMFLLANVLFRFRLHQAQIRLRPAPNVPKPRFIPGGHTSLQLIVTVEATALLLAALVLFEVRHGVSLALSSGFGALVFWVAERRVKAGRTNQIRPSD